MFGIPLWLIIIIFLIVVIFFIIIMFKKKFNELSKNMSESK